MPKLRWRAECSRFGQRQPEKLGCRRWTACRTDLLKPSLLPECRRLYPGNDFVFVQDSAPSHRAKVTQQFLRQNTPDFIAADEWVSYSPDLNPLDYCIWDILQDLVHEGRRLPFSNLRDLKEAVKNNWQEITIQTVRISIAQWKTDWMWLESRKEARFSTFSANHCDWISISCSETCWTYWLLCTLRTPDTLLRISLLKQKRQ